MARGDARCAAYDIEEAACGATVTKPIAAITTGIQTTAIEATGIQALGSSGIGPQAMLPGEQWDGADRDACR
ncbi:MULTISPECIES: hypothetical protein [Gordonia]|uniref:hypothetical protein n=1 Tax=Gordonia TaxID=2053 RepID=UPI0007EC1530|nr:MULTISPECIES: hypothetical protein [Gordonia]OBA73315.1 hypothetical protein A5777_00990 [Gordonia sp. 852002-10350_SCH5691597]